MLDLAHDDQPLTLAMAPTATDSERDSPAKLAGTSVTTVLVVDDSSTARLFVRRLVERIPGFRVVTASDGKEALAVLAKESCAVVVTDLHMPGMDGLELVEAIADRFPLVPVVLMTAQGNEDIAVKALQSGAASYVSKRALEVNSPTRSSASSTPPRSIGESKGCSSASANSNARSSWRTTPRWCRCS